MRKCASLLTALAFVAVSAPLAASVQPDLSRVRNHLIKNEGQYPQEVLYYSFPAGIYLTEHSVVVQGAELHFKGSRAKRVVPLHRTQAKFNYFVGRDRSRWKVGVPSYLQVKYEGIYPGIDLIFTALEGGTLEFQWVVKPGARVEEIEVEVRGGELVEREDGLYVVRGGKEIVKVAELRAYQGAEEVDVEAVRKGDGFTYRVGEYNPNHTLVIDPDLSSLSASTFLGGSNEDRGLTMALDNSGNVYVAGWTGSSDFPTTSGAYDGTYDGPSDAFVSVLSPDLSSLLSSTFLGGSMDDYITTVAIDGSGNVYVAGGTSSSDFPTTPGAYDGTLNGTGDAFISKLDGSLSTLIASTYIGGSDEDEIYALTLDNSGNVYVAGLTWSSDFPTTPGAYDDTHNGGYDAFVSKLSNDLTTLIASTYIGGSGVSEEIYALALDNSGNVYVAGHTNSPDFPTTPGAYDGSYNGGSAYGEDGFVSKLDGSLSTLIASTYIGGSDEDEIYALTLDNSGNVYVAGGTMSSDFPTTPGAYDGTPNGTDAFISKLDGSLSTLIASTYIGGSDFESIGAFGALALDNSGNVYVAGRTSSSDFPTTPGAYDGSFNGNGDVFVSGLSGDLTSLVASTFVGGTAYEYVTSLYLTASGYLYVVGESISSDFPTTPGAYDNTYNGNGDLFVLVFGPSTGVMERKSEGVSVALMGRKVEVVMPTAGYVGVSVIDASGRVVERVSAGFLPAGKHTLTLSLPTAGTYTLRVRAGKEVKTVRTVVLK